VDQIIIGFIAIVAGCASIIFKKQIVRYSITFQNRTFGFHFGEREIKASEKVAPFIGLFFITIGTLGILSEIGWL
jgi:hypothetical protein